MQSLLLVFWRLGFSGSPHPTERTKDPLHASAQFRRGDDFKGSGLSLHLYPDGRVVPSRAEYPEFRGTPATVEDLGKENARWLDPDYISAWQTEEASEETNNNAGKAEDTGKGKGKGKAKSDSSRQNPPKKHGSSGGGGGGESSKGQASHYGQYTMDPETQVLYRRAENGVVIYLDPDSQSEYFYDENGQAEWCWFGHVLFRDVIQDTFLGHALRLLLCRPNLLSLPFT